MFYILTVYLIFVKMPGNVYTHMAGFAEADIVSVYVCKYGKNDKRREVKMGLAHSGQRG